MRNQSWNWNETIGDQTLAKNKINPIKMAQRNMEKDKKYEFRGLTSPDAPSGTTAIALLSKRVGDLELLMSKLADELRILRMVIIK